jgi:hypothetical protein
VGINEMAGSPTEVGPGPRSAAAADRERPLARLRSRPGTVHLLVLAAFLIAGILETWPWATRLGNGHVPNTTDTAEYVWNFWWLAHCVTHLQNPWFTRAIAAPYGMQLGFDTLMPLPCLLLVPVTLAFGPAASYTLWIILLPGLLCYVMYRVARLWVTSQTAAIVAGALFGLATMVVWQAEYHIDTATGELFLPLALEACVRLRRKPDRRQAIILGVVVGVVFLVSEEMVILTLIMTGCALLPWLLRPVRLGSVRLGSPRLRRFGLTALAGVVAGIIAAPQLIAMAQQEASGGASVPVTAMAPWDGRFGVPAPTLFAPSPQVASFGLGRVAKIYQFVSGEGRPTFGLILTLLAVLGAFVAWRRVNARLLTALWLGSAALAMGTVLVIAGRTFVPLAQMWNGIRVSDLMPYTWFVRIPGLSSFREADRITLLGLVPAALLAASAVEWLLARHRVVLALALALAVLEAGNGWSAGGTVADTMPALDGPIAADHSGSLVVDVPFGLRGGVPVYGSGMVPRSLMIAMEDGHPRAISYTSWVAPTTTSADEHHPFYLGLVEVQNNEPVPAGQLAAARSDAAAMHVGWVLVWLRPWPRELRSYLASTGFRFDYRADGVSVYRPAP